MSTDTAVRSKSDTGHFSETRETRRIKREVEESSACVTLNLDFLTEVKSNHVPIIVQHGSQPGPRVRTIDLTGVTTPVAETPVGAGLMAWALECPDRCRRKILCPGFTIVIDRTGA